MSRAAVMVDIEKSFHKVELQTAGRDVTHFSWLKDTTLPVSDGNVEEMFTRVTFRVVSIPFLLNHNLAQEPKSTSNSCS